jgi:hypothetical protein
MGARLDHRWKARKARGFGAVSARLQSRIPTLGPTPDHGAVKHHRQQAADGEGHPEAKPRRINSGMTRNIGSEGSTNENMPVTCAIIRSGSCVSRHSHIIPKTDTSGSDQAAQAGIAFRNFGNGGHDRA